MSFNLRDELYPLALELSFGNCDAVKGNKKCNKLGHTQRMQVTKFSSICPILSFEKKWIQGSHMGWLNFAAEPKSESLEFNTDLKLKMLDNLDLIRLRYSLQDGHKKRKITAK